MISGRRMAMVGVGATVGVLAGVLVGATPCCWVELHPANRPTAVASLIKSRLEMPRGHELLSQLFSLVIIGPPFLGVSISYRRFCATPLNTSPRRVVGERTIRHLLF